MSRRRTVTEDEARLWRRVVADVSPMPGAAAAAAPEEAGREARGPRLRGPERRSAPAAPPAPPSSAYVDKGLERRLRRGREAVDRRIDLHGMTQDEAFDHLVRRLGAAAGAGERCVLVITGKGAGGEGDPADPLAPGRGVLRRRFQDWAALPPLSGVVRAIREAHPRHGGAGAFYVFLRRPRRTR